MNVLPVLLIGAVVGWVVSRVLGCRTPELLFNVLVGSLGGFLGGALLGSLFGLSLLDAGFRVTLVLLALTSAAIAVALVMLARRVLRPHGGGRQRRYVSF